jgi:hypothetical protein
VEGYLIFIQGIAKSGRVCGGAPQHLARGVPYSGLKQGGQENEDANELKGG